MTLNLIDLDECVIRALDLFAKKQPPTISSPYKKPLVLGSGNAAVTGRIIFNNTPAVFADESTFEATYASAKDVDGCILISASGGKHAPLLAKRIKELGLPVTLFTNNPQAPARTIADTTLVFPKNPEPYTYNTSTYLGMILGKTREDPTSISQELARIKPTLPDFSAYNAFVILVPDKFDAVRELFLTKFDELFGPVINGRVFTEDQVKHAKTVVPSDKELFIGLGVENTLWGTHRYNTQLPKNAGPGTAMAIGYYIIGHIQKSHPPYFKDNIEAYTQKISRVFGETITPIVD